MFALIEFDKREGSSVGETRVCPDTGLEFTVVWDGGPLLGPRPTKNLDLDWRAPRRIYNKKAGVTVQDAYFEEEDYAHDLELDFTTKLEDDAND